jgi:hypothetical protein
MGLTAGVALALYGLRARVAPSRVGGVVLGVALAVAFLTRGLLGPAWLLVSVALLPAVGSAWRTRAYAATAAIAIVSARRSPRHGPLRSRCATPRWCKRGSPTEAAPGYFAPPGTDGSALTYFPRNLLWFAWPALPLVAWMLWTRGPRLQRRPCPARRAGARGHRARHAGSLLLIPDPRVTYALPLLAPLAILASLEGRFA